MKYIKFLLFALLITLGIINVSANNKAPKTILLVSGWQDVNIGDIAHTPGLLNVLDSYLHSPNIILWEKNKSEKVELFLKQKFPNLHVISGDIDENLNVTSPEILNAFEKADIMIHGSGPYIVGQYHLEAWVKYTQKPFGIFGTTITSVDERLKSLLLQAKFIYTRETASIEVLRKAGIIGKHIGFAPDATFFFDCHDDKKAKFFLKSKGLEEGKFICVVPRLRKTPYYLIKNRHLWSDRKIKEVEEYNALYKEKDHAKLREAMIKWVRETNNKVLVCPEMT